MDVKVPQVNTLSLKQLLERWPHYSLDNIYELANQGCFGLYVKPLVKKKTTYHINPYLNKLIAAAKKRHEELENYIQQKKELITYFSRYGFLLKSINGYVRLATQKETELFPLTQTSSIQDLIEFNKVDYLDFNNTFGFEGSLSDPQANSYHLTQYSNATHQPPQDYKGYFTDKDLYVLVEQIEHFEIINGGAEGEIYFKFGFQKSIEQSELACLHLTHDESQEPKITKPSIDNSPAEKEFHNSFIKSVNYYEILYANHKTIQRASNGLIYIEILLKNPHRDIHVNALESLVSNILLQNKGVGLIDLNELNIHAEDHSSSQKMTDKKTIKEIKNDLAEIDDKIAIAKEAFDIETLEELEEKKQFCLDYINDTIGLKSMLRNFTNPTEKARKRVLSNIKNAIKSIATNNPLHTHLVKSIKTGEFCAYKPAKDTNWVFDNQS
ncbi:TPA: hypothetical protein JBI17_11510 [Legionella pneumophila]|nr:hypothetical protein [Legionella pneumophila]